MSVCPFSSVAQLCPTLCNPMDCSTPGLPVHHQSLLKLMSIGSMMPSTLILCRPLLHLPSIFPTIRVFSNEPVVCIKSPKHWSFSFNISPSSEYSGLISFRMDWLDLMQSKGSSRVSPAPQFKSINSLRLSIPGGSAGQESTCNAGDLGLISGLEKSSEKGTAIHSSILA